jgi:hypothetical protein
MLQEMLIYVNSSRAFRRRSGKQPLMRGGQPGGTTSSPYFFVINNSV